jgi:hypothetical protein
VKRGGTPGKLGRTLSHLTYNDRLLHVTPNLYGALEGLRRNRVSARWWTDAICISQGHVEEKTQQAHLMRRIYESALGTVIWLGESWDGLPPSHRQQSRNWRQHLLQGEKRLCRKTLARARILKNLPKHRTSPERTRPSSESLALCCRTLGLRELGFFKKLWYLSLLACNAGNALSPLRSSIAPASASTTTV